MKFNTVKDYIEWRGDLSFDSVPLNEVDNILFSLLAYLDFSMVGPGIYIGDILEKYEANKESTKKSGYHSKFKKGIEGLLVSMSNSKRYKDVMVADYVSKLDEVNQSQFAAVTFVIGFSAVYVAFRGTDNTFIGYKEDFNMSFSDHVAGHLESIKYLKHIMNKYKGSNLYVGGHSKGGNFAVFSVCGIDDMDRERIIRVYNNDGPGFSKNIVESYGYKQTSEKTLKIMPKDSIVGVLMNADEKSKWVNAKGSTGFIQHDAQNWEVMGDHFVEVESGDQAVFMGETIRAWLNKLSEDERELFVDEVYNIIRTTTDAKKLSDISDGKLMLTLKFIKNMKDLEPEKKEVMLGVVSSFFETASFMRKQGLESKKMEAKGGKKTKEKEVIKLDVKERIKLPIKGQKSKK